MKLSILQMIFAQNVAKLIQYIFQQGYSCTLGEALRTQEMAEIYAKRGTGIRNSLHLKKLAIDLNLFKDGVLLTASQKHKPFGDYWESLNTLNRWGGDWNGNDIVDPGDDDGNHYEMREG